MPRDGNGNYTLPAGNPVVPGSLIESDWANPTMSDLATEVQDSLSRSGKGGMLVPFNNVSGTAGNPGITFTIDNQTGRYLFNVGDMRDVVGGLEVARYQSSAITYLVDVFFAGPITVDSLVCDGLLQADSIISDTTISSTGTITSGDQVKSTASDPIDADDLTRKDYVDSEISNVVTTEVSAKVDKVQPAGSQFLLAVNNDPTTGLAYNSLNNAFEFRVGGVTKARIDLDTGDISTDGFIQSQGL